MKIKNMYFSPTYSTEKISKMVVGGLGYEAEDYDISLLAEDKLALELDDKDLLVIAMPVYGGRVPQVALKKLEGLKGKNTKAIVIVTYGNRDYDDALLELKDFVEEKDFQVIGAAAVVTEHSIIGEIAKGRPDNSDIELIHGFADKIKNRLDREEFTYIKVKGNPEYKEAVGSGARPTGIEEKCIDCGICFENCPMDAILEDKKFETDEKCILCMRCIKICPENARVLDEKIYEGTKAKIIKACKHRKEPEFY